jgi:hypothetical protein
MLVVLAILFAPIMSNGASLILQRVITYSDGTPIPDELINMLRYRYYYADNGTGPYIEGTATIDNLVIAIPDPAPGTMVGYTVDSELEGVFSAKAEPQILAALPPPDPQPQKSSGCSWRN